MKDYMREIRVMSIVFWLFFMIFISIGVYITSNLESVCDFYLCHILIFKIFPVSFLWIVLLPIFLINKNFNKVRNAGIFFFLLLVLNSMRAPAYDDFLAIGPKPTYIYIYILEFVFAIYILIKNRK